MDTLDSLLSTDPLDIVVSTSPLPENLLDQRQWAEVRKLQIDTERAAAELDAYRRTTAWRCSTSSVTSGPTATR